MIETVTDLSNFISESSNDEIIIHLIPTGDNSQHPSTVNPCILFIRNILSNKTYYYSFSHPDSRPKISSSEFIEAITKLSNIKWVLDKKNILQICDKFSNLYDANLCGYLRNNEILDLMDYETPAHTLVRRNSVNASYVNQCIPLLKHKELFDQLADDIIKMIKDRSVVDNVFHTINESVLVSLASLEHTGLYVDKNIFTERFHVPDTSGFVYSHYNIYTSTGRPSNAFGKVNYAALNNTDGSRKCFVSRFGNDGKLVLIDYTSFHPRIVCKLVGYELPISIDIYEYLAKLYFRKKDVDESDIQNAKMITFRQFYGGVEDKYSHIKYLNSLKTYIDDHWDFFQKNGFVETPFFKRKITKYHICDATPTKIFNYILQAAEGELVIPRLEKIQAYLKNYQTKPILYTYDSILYDFYYGDGIDVFNNIRNLMNVDNGYSFKTYIGDNYHDMKLINL